MEKPDQTTQAPPDPPKRYVTTHNAAGKAVFSQDVSESVSTNSIPGMLYYEAYKTFGNPIDLNDETDIKSYVASDDAISFPKPGEITLRYCDWPPGGSSPLHRHETIDYALVVHGEIEAFMDSGETRLLKTGDCLVQRNTLHGWRNPSLTDYARVVFVIQGCPPVIVAGKEMVQDLGAFGA
jgi:quercetin dioxygenase-like cupin family protein